MYKHLASQENKSKKPTIAYILMKKEKQALFYANKVESIAKIKAKNRKVELFITQLDYIVLYSKKSVK